ncbi:MAG: hydroxymethylglutaryl-CoA lyase [Gracilibacteraceae bacterium]|jgi:hydroxymethylglutaryl-CoA lyase|nr:hydroxymethylglutaryl-CoA lyase [Gracilibacteraceae bacterium]
MGKRERVYICECWGRDGLQNIAKIIPTAEKTELINKMAHAGYARIETTSFSNPKQLPQFADAEDVLRRIERVPGVCYKATTINERALDRAIAAKNAGYGPTEVTFMISVSERHNIFNTKLNHAEHWAQFERMAEKAHANDLKIIATLGTVYGCPLDGDVPPEQVWRMTEKYLTLAPEYIVLGDTTGAGNPLTVKEMFGELIARRPHIKYVAHFHDTRGTGVANVMAAFASGVRYFDCSLGGIGGQPAGYGHVYHQGFSGNVCSEDVICMFDEMGVDTGISQEDAVALGLRAEEIIGAPQRSNVLRCGPVSHAPKPEYE